MQQADDNNRVTVHDSFHPFPPAPPSSPFFYPFMWAAAWARPGPVWTRKKKIYFQRFVQFLTWLFPAPPYPKEK